MTMTPEEGTDAGVIPGTSGPSDAVGRTGESSGTQPACGSGATDCSEVLRDVWLFLDDEMDPERRAVVQHHLDDCSPCLLEAGLDAKLKALLRTKCGGERAPDGLRDRLVTQFSRVDVAADGESAVVVSSTVLTAVEFRP